MVHQMPGDGLRPIRPQARHPRSRLDVRPRGVASPIIAWVVALTLLFCLGTACNLSGRNSRQNGLTSSPARTGNASIADPQQSAGQADDLVAQADPNAFRQAAWPLPPTDPQSNPGIPLGNPVPQQQAGYRPPQQGWPGDNVGVSAGPPIRNPLLDQNDSDLYDPTVTVATVGNQYILRGDLIGDANVMLAPNVEKIPPQERDAQASQILAARDQMAKQLLAQAVERKLMYLEFLRSIPEGKRAEAEANIQERIGSAFDKDLAEMVEKVRKADEKDYAELAREDTNIFRLALLMNEQEMVTSIQLDNYLRRYGSSLDKQRQAFAERALGRQALMTGIETQPEVTHIEMLDYYNQRLEQFQVPDRAKWEQLTARFDHFNTKEEARAAINAMGNEVWLGGAPFAAVAKRSSQGRFAKEGGVHDWTDWGDLEVSREVQEVVFSIPTGELSPIIETVDGFHIVRVIDRKPAHITPFTEAQATIKNKLRGEKRGAEIAEFVTKLREQTPIWTIYDDVGETDQRVADPSPRPNQGYPR